MKHEKSVLSVLSLSALLITFLIGGCGSDDDNAPPPDTWGRPQTSPENVVYNLRQAIIERDSLHYAAQLADSFTFVFAPQDVGGQNIPEAWGRADEIVAMSRMFGGKVNRDGYVCEAISLTWSASPADTTPEFPTWTRVRVSNVFAVVSSRHGVSGDPLDYLVEGDQEDFWFQSAGSEWRLARWEDKPISTAAPGGAEQSSFGQIKSKWR